MKITNQQLKTELDCLSKNISNVEENLHTTDNRLQLVDEANDVMIESVDTLQKSIVHSQNKIRRLVTKVNKLEQQIEDNANVCNENLAKQTMINEHHNRMIKFCFAGIIFLGLILIACI